MINTKTILFISFISVLIVISAIILLINDPKLATKTEISSEQVIKLEENPTTGYTWHYIIEEPAIIQIISDEYLTNEENEGLVGEGGIHTWYLEGLKEGTTNINFNLYRPWEGIEKSIDSVIFSVTVSSDLQITDIAKIKSN